MTTQDQCDKCSTLRISMEDGKRRLDNTSSEPCGECTKWIEEQFNERV